MRYLLLIALACMVLIPNVGYAQTSTKGVLFAPSIELHALVYVAPLVRGETWLIDAERVVWLSGTAWIDQDRGRVVLAGHTPGVFDRLGGLLVGDVITLSDMRAGVMASYRVETVITVSISDLRWVQPSQDARLTLITCNGDWRLIVDAAKVEP
jgi:LPXTG-site transpeptidase (sortase) family protein